MITIENNFISAILEYSEYTHDWEKRQGFIDKNSTESEKLLLIHSEVSEAAEGLRKGDRKNIAEECADIAIRLFNYCAWQNINLGQEIVNKMKINEQRKYKHGKRF